MSNESGAEMPEFHIVVKRPTGKGPLAPFRFAASVVVAIVIAFGGIRDAIATGVADDAVLLRAVAAAVFTWVVLSVLNRVLAPGASDRTVVGERADPRADHMP